MSPPIVIAHRGASGYLPEHTFPAKALAYAMGADFLEQDVVASRDDELVVLHDIHIDRVSDVAARHPGRARADGRYYVRDFDLAELQDLALSERVDAEGAPVYPRRYPPRTGSFRVHTLAEELEFVGELNAASGRHVGVYPEIKRPAWHREEGVDIAPLMLDVLSVHGYETPDDPVYLQCFDEAELVRIRRELGCRLRLVQLIGENSWGESATDYAALQSDKGLRKLARSVDAIGPWIEQCYAPAESGPKSTGLVEHAHKAGLLVHPYTVRHDSLQPGFADLASLLTFLIDELGVDGLFTDFPDLVRRFVAA